MVTGNGSGRWSTVMFHINGALFHPFQGLVLCSSFPITPRQFNTSGRTPRISASNLESNLFCCKWRHLAANNMPSFWVSRTGWISSVGGKTFFWMDFFIFYSKKQFVHHMASSSTLWGKFANLNSNKKTTSYFNGGIFRLLLAQAGISSISLLHPE